MQVGEYAAGSPAHSTLLEACTISVRGRFGSPLCFIVYAWLSRSAAVIQFIGLDNIGHTKETSSLTMGGFLAMPFFILLAIQMNGRFYFVYP